MGHLGSVNARGVTFTFRFGPNHILDSANRLSPDPTLATGLSQLISRCHHDTQISPDVFDLPKGLEIESRPYLLSLSLDGADLPLDNHRVEIVNGDDFGHLVRYRRLDNHHGREADGGHGSQGRAYS